MNNVTTFPPSDMESLRADRVGIVASVLCAIHCAAAPILLIFLPAFGSIWAHPASHILVAILVIPLAFFSIRKGFKKHGKRWIVVSAGIGILFVLVGAALPAFGNDSMDGLGIGGSGDPSGNGAAGVIGGEWEDPECTDPECEDPACESGCESEVKQEGLGGVNGCVDGCCPTATIGEDGELSIHVPPASIVTTLGGIFLIAAHIGNLCACRGACRQGHCGECTA